MGKILHIEDAYIKLPDDFSGNLSDALFLFYQSRVKSEQLNEISIEKNVDFEKFNSLKNKKYSVSYEILESNN